MIIGGQLERLDLVDLIAKYFIGLERLNFLLFEVPLEVMTKTGWKFGIMFLWNLINELTENS